MRRWSLPLLPRRRCLFPFSNPGRLARSALTFVLALPSLGSSVAFAAETSIATIDLYINYGLTIMIGLIWHRSFAAMKGLFGLGFFSRPIATAACAWIAFISIVCYAPTANPVPDQTHLTTPSLPWVSLPLARRECSAFSRTQACISVASSTQLESHLSAIGYLSNYGYVVRLERLLVCTPSPIIHGGRPAAG